MPNGDTIQVSDQEQNEWDETFWGEVNCQFDEELSESQMWAHLVDRKLVVWDGNHQLKAWSMEINSDKDDKEYVARYKQTIHEVEQAFKAKRGFKLVAVANLALGDQWINKLYDLDWESEHNVTLDKLLTITQTPLPIERWFAKMMRIGQIKEIPPSVEEWKVVFSLGYKLLYPLSWLDAHRELQKNFYGIPWFLEYPEGKYPIEEKALYTNLICKQATITSTPKKNIETRKVDKSTQIAKSPPSKIPSRGGKGNLKEQVQSPNKMNKGSKRKKQEHALKGNHGKGKQIVPSKKKVKGKKGSSEVANEDKDALQAFVPFHLPIQDNIEHIAADTKVMKTFLAKLQEVGGFYDDAKVTLIWANQESRLEPFEENDDLPAWNKWKEEYLYAAISNAEEFLTTDGTFVVTIVLERYFDVITCVIENNKLAFCHAMYLETAT
ncbi:hypothetical protein L7F22_013133 [Adiantum nelumboides]|nr:hypothetical protein [Adiantum nelumboides]